MHLFHEFIKNWILVLTLACSPVWAAPVIIESDRLQGKPLGKHLLLLEDASSQLTISEVHKLPDDAFQKAQENIPNFSFTRSAYWARLVLDNKLARALPLILEYAYPMADYVELYIPAAEGQWEKFVSGDQTPPSKRQIRYRQPAFPLELPTGTTTLHVRVKTEGVNQFPIYVWDPTAFYDKRMYETGLLFLLAGFLLVMCLYNGFIWFSTRDKSLLIYIPFIIIAGSAQFLGNTSLIHISSWDSVAPFLSNTGYLICSSLGTGLACLLTLRILEITKQNSIAIFSLSGSFVACILCTFLAFVSYNPAAKATSAVLLFSFAAILLASLQKCFQRFRPAYFFTLAWLCSILGVICNNLAHSALIPALPIFRFGPLVGLACEVVLISLVIGDKMRRQIEQTLQENRRINAELVEKEKARTIFFHNTSHELRTPLNGIIGFIDLVRQGQYGPLQDKARLQLDKALRLAESLKHQVNTILDLAKSRRGDLRLQAQFLDLNRLKAEADNLAEGLCLKNPRLHYRSQLTVDTREAVFVGDYDKLFTIIRNLLGNAFKFSAHDRDNEVTLKMELLRGTLTVEVIDQGIGIPEEFKHKIFEEFTQVQSDARRSYEGTGLGLTMVSDLIHLMQGQLRLDSTPDVGSHFTLSIPSQSVSDIAAAQPETVLVRPAAHPGESHGVIAFQETTPTVMDSGVGQGWEVLVIDDNETNCEVISEILKAEGFQVDHAVSGRDGLAKMSKKQPALLFLDMMMPEMSGEDVLRVMRADPILREIPVILITARASEEDRVAGLRLGADDYMAKPIVAAEIRLRAGNMIERHRLIRQVERTEAQDRLVQLGELFADLSHELRNIIQSSLNVRPLAPSDLERMLASLHLPEAKTRSLVQGMASTAPQPNLAERLKLLPPPPQDEIVTIRRSLRMFLAELDMNPAELESLWAQMNQAEPDAILNMECVIRLLREFQTLYGVHERGRVLVESVLSYTRISSAGVSANIREVWQQVQAVIQPRLKRGHVTFKVELDDAILSIAPGSLMQILLNLVINALDAVSRLPAEDKWITIQSRSENDGLRLEISNGGPPIPDEIAPRIFERGFTTKGEKGSGIGLHVCRKLAMQAQAEIRYVTGKDHPCFAVSFGQQKHVLRKAG
jgi:signal transduction histidine kinase